MTALQNEMERVGRITAADQSLEVHIRGVRAYATDGTVTIPNIETYEWLGKNAHRMLHGLLDHECGHALDSDFDALYQFKAARPPAALVTLQNIAEDGYVERLRGRRYIGCGRNIQLMNEWFYRYKGNNGKHFMERISEESEGLWQAFLMAIGTVLTPYGHRDIEFYEKLNPNVYQMLCSCRKDIEELQGITRTKATEQIISVCRRIYERFKEEQEKEEQKEQEQKEKGDNGDSSDEENRGENEETEDSDSESSDKKDDEPEPDENEEGEGDDSEEDEPGKEGGEDGEGEECVMPPEVAFMDLERWSRDEGPPMTASEQINVIIRDVFERSEEELQPYTVFSHEFDAFRDFSREDLSKATDAYNSEMEEANSASESLVQCFEAALHATEMARPIGGNDEGEVDVTVLPEYAVGSLPADQLYTQYVETDANDVAVEIICDCSGSMHGAKYKLCRQAAMVMSHALQQVQIAYEVSGFTTLTSNAVQGHQWSRDKWEGYAETFQAMRRALLEAEKRGTDLKRFAREIRSYGNHDSSTERINLLVPFNVIFKSFESEDARGLINITSTDQNLDGESVLWAAQRLAERPERRKVLFVLSDGLPTGSRDNEQGARYLKEVIDRVVDSGIEVYGIGIKSNHVRDYYPEWWLCQDLSDLTEVAMTGLIEVLTRNRTERDRIHL